jgi:cytoskeletal protein CcmA (bactofilin family)
VRGAIYAEERVELQSTSVVHGDVSTKRLLIQEGGEINGVLRMGEDAGHPPQVGQRAQSRQAAPSAF